MTLLSPERLIAQATRDNVIRRAEKDAIAWQRAHTSDSFQNFIAQVGLGTNNQTSASTYGFNPISRVRTLLEWMYRGSWIVGKAVDAIAEDMTKTGVSWLGDTKPQDLDKLNTCIVRNQLWPRLQQGIKWARLYGGALVVMIIDGQKLDTPLRPERIKSGQFKGFIVIDRWMVNPSFSELISDPADPDQGFPAYYDVVTYAPPALIGKRIHHSRVIRLVGVELPYWQMVYENYWGMSVLERLYDRLVAFDSSTQGAAQLMYRAYLRTLSVKNLREIIAEGGPAYQGLIKQIEMMRLMQTNEGMSVVDAEDKFEGHAYSFAGVGETILQMGQQLAGAIDTPLTRLFGQAPAGLNSTGESDMRNYDDGILQRQETTTRRPLEIVFRVMAQSEGVKLNDSFGFAFNPLHQMTDQQKAETAERSTNLVIATEAAGLVTQQVALKELKQQSRTTGVWTNITDEDINAAATELPPPASEVTGEGEEGDIDIENLERTEKVRKSLVGDGGDISTKAEAVAEAKKRREAGENVRILEHTFTNPRTGHVTKTYSVVTRDNALPLIEVAGLPIMIENPRGTRRTGAYWSVIMPADYGFIRATKGADGDGVDCFVGQGDADQVWVIDALDRVTGKFDEHKVMLKFDDVNEALAHFKAAYSDGGRIGGVTRLSIDQLKQWLDSGDKTKPLGELRVA